MAEAAPLLPDIIFRDNPRVRAGFVAAFGRSPDVTVGDSKVEGTCAHLVRIQYGRATADVPGPYGARRT